MNQVGRQFGYTQFMKKTSQAHFTLTLQISAQRLCHASSEDGNISGMSTD
jgi:hypothetical protein